MNKITDIVFDVGRVLVDFRYDDLFCYLRAQGAQFTSVDDFAEKVDLRSYECGLISNDDFIDKVCDILSEEVDRSELISYWTELFQPIEEMLNLAAHLKTDFGVYLLSNTSALHWNYLKSVYKLGELSTDLLASFEVGTMKPEQKIFKEAEKRFGLFPERTLFIDDIEENVEGARACGWQGIHHIGIDRTKEKMETLLMRSFP